MTASPWRSQTIAPQAGRAISAETTQAHPVIILTLAKSVHPVTLDGRLLLFLEHSQEICEINPAAESLIALLTKGIALTEEGLLCTGAAGQNADWPYEGLAAVLPDWSAHGIIKVDWLTRDSQVMPGLYLNAGRVVFELLFPPGELGNELSGLYAHLPSHAPPPGNGLIRRLQVGAFGDFAVVRLDGESTRLVPRAQVASRIHNILLESMLCTPGLILLHAACVQVNERAFLLFGPPGAGKSTLAHALSPYVDALCGDDVVAFDPATGRVRAVPFPLTMKEGGWQVALARDAELEDRPTELRADDVAVRYVPLPTTGHGQWLEIGHLVSLNREGLCEPTIAGMDEVAALRIILAEAHSANGRSSFDLVQRLSEIVARAGKWRLTYHDSSEAAIRLVDALAAY